jgi:hypothetical protein
MDTIRNGNFTSGNIGKLMSNGKAKGEWGAPAWTYIEEKNMERRLGRPLNDDVDSKPTTWGKLCEGKVFELLGLDYELISDKTLRHPTVDCWCGTPDAIHHGNPSAVVDIKCPKTMKSFCNLVDAWQTGGLEALRQVTSGYNKVGELYYYQLVSNAILTGLDFAELIVFVPYRSELQSIRELASNWNGEKQHRYRWIDLADDDELPFLPDGGHYKNLNVMRFEIPQEDKQALHDRVIAAGLSLEPNPELLTH